MMTGATYTLSCPRGVVMISVENWPGRKRPVLVGGRAPGKPERLATFDSDEDAAAFMALLDVLVGEVAP